MKRILIFVLLILALPSHGAPKERVPKNSANNVIIELLKLFNTVLELKIEHELFPQTLVKVLKHLENIEISCQEKEQLEKRIRTLIALLGERGQQEAASNKAFYDEIIKFLSISDSIK